MTKLYTVDQVAEILGCTTKTVYTLVASNSIPHLRVGKLIRFDPEALERWIRRDEKLLPER